MAILRLALVAALLAAGIGAALGVGLFLWSFFAAGDCALWLQSKIPFTEPIRPLGETYMPVCDGGVAWSFRLASMGVLAGTPLVLLLLDLIPRLERRSRRAQGAEQG